MSIKSGSFDVSALKAGSFDVSAVYSGTEKIWPVAAVGQVELAQGTGSWTVPDNVSSICVVLVSKGGSGGVDTGGGGALGWRNNIAVTPGQVIPYTISTADAGTSRFGSASDPWRVECTNGNTGTVFVGGAGGTVIAAEGGGNGGKGGNRILRAGEPRGVIAGGGGAGGYTGNGGAGANDPGTALPGSGGGGGGGNAGGNCRGGGVGLQGQGANGAPGCPGGAGSGGSGVNWGGGAATQAGNVPGDGRIRIIWGEGRFFPNTNTADV